MECQSCKLLMSHKEVVGRVNAPPGSVKRVGMKISYKGIWDIWTCKICGWNVKKIRK